MRMLGRLIKLETHRDLWTAMRVAPHDVKLTLELCDTATVDGLSLTLQQTQSAPHLSLVCLYRQILCDAPPVL